MNGSSTVVQTVQVNDENGKPLGKVKVGDTKLQALERLSRVGAGGLYDKYDIGLLDSESITAEAAPYIFKGGTGASPDDKKRKYGELEKENLTHYDPALFYSPSDTPLPVVYENDEIQPFLAPEGWLNDTAKDVLKQADLKETNNPRVSPVALVRCSRGGKTRSMIELANAVRAQDPSYGILYMTFSTDTPLQHKPAHDPMTELCVRIAFAASKVRSGPTKQYKEFLDFSRAKRVCRERVEDWLGNNK